MPMTRRTKEYAMLEEQARADNENTEPLNANNYFDAELINPKRLKAELIRRKLVSRQDLMSLYRRPIKISSLPQNNPFLTKTILRPHYAMNFRGST